MFRKSFIVVGMIVLMLVSPILTAAEKQFSDLKRDNDHYEGIQWIVTKGITGYEDGTFGVERALSRQHAARMFGEVLDLNLPAKIQVKEYFSDVGSNHEYADYIAAMYVEGIFKGNSGKFSPNNRLTREQMATTIVNAFELKGTGEVSVYLGNVDPSHRKNVQILADLGLTTELDNFRPGQSITRGQFASFLYRVYQLNEEKPVEPAPEPEEPTEPEPANPDPNIVSTFYDFDFNTVVARQMDASPQTDSAGSWYHASKGLVEYYVNPNNFKQDSTGFYQFLLLSGSTSISAQQLNNQILAGQGVLAGRGADFKEASAKHNVNDIYLIAHALLETGNGTSNLATGVPVGQDKDGKAVMLTEENKADLTNVKETYNFYGIGALDRCPLTCGSERAYNEGWFTYKDAIIGGAEFINNGYISRGQDTLYKMRWNPTNPGKYPQYATDVGWGVKQTSRIERVYDLYQRVGNVSMTFDVPAYRNLPAAKARPTGAAVFHVNTNHKDAGKKGIVTADALNFRTGPTTQFSAIRQLAKGTEVTIIGENSGWYKIKAGSDEGWVSALYIQIGEMKMASTFAQIDQEPVSEQDNPLTTAVEEERVIGEIVAEKAQFRSSATDSDDNVEEELPVGTKLDIVDETAGWFKVSIDGEVGWIENKSIVLVNVFTTQTRDAAIKAGASEDSMTIGELFEHDTVIVVPNKNNELTVDGEWYQIYHAGQTAWIHQGDIK